MKKHYFKKGVACLLSAALVLTGTGVMPEAVKTASAAVDVPNPVLSLDFDSGTLSGSTYTEGGFQFEVVGAEKVADPDNSGNSVMSFSASTDGSVKGNQYLRSKLGALSTSSFTNGFTISMRVRPKKLTVDGADWTYLFALGHADSITDSADSFGGWNYVDGTMGLITRYGDAYTGNFPNDGWVPGNPANSQFDYFVAGDGAEKWSTVTYVYDKDNVSIYMNEDCVCQWGASSALAEILKTVNTGRLNLGTGISAFAESYVGYMDDVKVFNAGLSAEQIYKLVTGKEPVSVDKNELNQAIQNADKVRLELYTDFSVFTEKLADAKAVSSNALKTQAEVDAAKEALIAAQKALVLKPVDLTKDLVLDSDMSSNTSVIDKTKKTVTAGGHTITALGSSTVEDGYIQSSKTGAAGQAGVSVDKSVLEGDSLEKGLTFNIKWKFSTAPATDWWDLISFAAADNASGYLMRNTVGFVNVVGATQLFPGADCKNGYAWDSCKSYATNVEKDLTVSIDNTGIRMYVDGVLACEKTDLTGCDFSKVFSDTKNIYIGHALNPLDGDLQGQLDGLQVYHRALNPAEVDKLAADGTGASFGLSSTEVSVEKGGTQTVELADTVKPADTSIKSAVSGDSKIATAEVKDGKVVVTGVAAGETIITVNSSYGQSVACAVNVVAKAVAVTGVTLNKQTASIEEGGTLTLTATVTPEDATSKSVTWQSDNTSVATVDANGKVTGIKAGTATITAISKEDATKSASCKVTVTESSGSDDDNNGGGTITDESQLGTYRSDLAYKRVSVHDPSVVKDPKTNRYYIFGSHCAWAWSDDLENWQSFTNNITEGNDGSANTIFKDEIAWCKKANANYSVTGNLWAPDVIWDSSYKNSDGTTGAWLMYMSINGPDWNSTISLLTADRLDGNWTYVGPVIQSGMSKGYGVTFDYTKVTGETTVNSRYTSNVSGGGNPTLEAHAIDPCVLYDENGDLWMSYGSWSGGISMIKLDNETGLRDYSMTYADTNNEEKNGVISDPYTGYKIAGGVAVSGEGSYIKKIGDYYFLFLSYGGYAPEGGYNMRVFRASDITGPYKDVANKDARTALNGKAGDTAGTTGMRLMSYYKWSFADYGYTAQGHNSAIVDAASGKAFVVYHNKYNDGTAAHEVRVHQLLTNEDGWILSAPFEYAGETVKESGYTQNAIAGDYGIMFQKQNIAHAKLECASEQKITLEEGTKTADGGYTGKITGDCTGTWESKASSPYVTLKIGTTTYKGVLCEGVIDETDVKTMTFTAVGDNQECLWGYKVKDPKTAIRMTIDKVIHMPDEVATDIPLPTTGVGGSTITWKSNSAAIADDGTIPHLFNEDSKVSMTATITNNGYEFAKNYEFTVLGNTKLASESDVAIKKFYTDTELDMTKLSKGNCPKFANPFYYTHEDISNGVSISFDAVRSTSSIDALSNLISFNNKLGKLYFAGGSYLGYNDFNGRFIDANLKNYAVVKDYMPANTKVTIKIEITSSGFTVYQNGMKAYSFDDIKSGAVPGSSNGTNPETTMLSWLKTAPELNFGSGNFWDGIFNGKISNVVCSYKQPELDVNGGDSLSGIYVQDYEKVSDISTEWTSTSAQGNLSLGSGDAGHGKYMLFDFTGEGTTNGRGARSYFGDGIEWPEGYILEYDIAIKPGTDGSASQRSQIAVVTDKVAYSSNNENYGVTTGYVFKMAVSSKGIGEVNDDTSTANQVTLPNSGWVHITLTGTKGSTAAHLKITDGDTVLYDKDVTATDTGTIKGLYILAGRYQAVIKVDNIVVKDQSGDYGVRAVYNKILARAEQFVALQEESPVYSSDSYQALTDAIAAAKDSVTDASTNEELNAHITALQEAIDGLERAYYTVTVVPSENGTVTGLAADGKYFAGDSITLTAVPNAGFKFTGWKVGGEVVSENTVYSAMVTENVTITPVFEKDDTPSSPSAPGSSSSPSPSPSMSPPGSASASPSTSPSSSPSGSGSSGSSGTPIQPGVTSSPSAAPSATPSVKPSESPSADPGTNPGTSAEPGTSSTPGETTAPTEEPSPSSSPSGSTTVKEGTVYKQGVQKYKVTSATAKKKTVTLYNVNDKSAKTYKVGATVKIKNQTYKVTAIAPKAFANCKKLEKVTIGKNVVTIGSKAFANCKNLKTITIGKGVTTIGPNCFANCKNVTKIIIKSTVLKKVGKNAFKGINSRAVIKVPKAKVTKYKKLLNKKGQSSSVKITK